MQREWAAARLGARSGHSQGRPPGVRWDVRALPARKGALRAMARWRFARAGILPRRAARLGAGRTRNPNRGPGADASESRTP